MKPYTQASRSIASQFNKEHGWDVDAALTLAHEVLEDANYHGAARFIHAAMDPIPAALIPGAIEAMWMRGGGFARQMAAAWRMADHGDRELIEVAFRHLILPYVANNNTGFSPGDRVTFSVCDRGTVRAVADGLVQVDFDDGGEGWHKPSHLVATSE